MSNKNCTTDLMLGAIVGGIACTLTVMLLAPKFMSKPSRHNNNNLMQSLSDHFDEISIKASTLIDNITQKTQEIALGASSYTEEWVEKALALSNTVIEELSRWEAAIKEAVITTTVQAEQMTESEGQNKLIDALEWGRKALNVAENAIKEINSWAEIVKDIAEGSLPQSKSFKSTHRNRESSHRNEEPSSHIAMDVLEWATLGLNLWQSVKKRR